MSGDSVVRSASQRGSIRDLTVPGCLLETALLLEAGQSVQLRVYLDSKRPMRIDLGIVRWTQDGKAGVEFIRMAVEDQLRLRFYVGYIEKRPRPSNRWTRHRCVWGFRGGSVVNPTWCHGTRGIDSHARDEVALAGT